MANTATVEIIVSARDRTTAAFGAIGQQLKSLERQAQAIVSGLGIPFQALGGVLGTVADVAGTVVTGAFSALKTAVGWVRDQIDNLIEGCERAAIAFGALTAALTALISKITMYAARTEELGVALTQVAKVAGHSTEEVQAQEEAVKALGITTQASQTLLMRMLAAELDMADATKIARAAQDLAVIGMRDSSEATMDLIYAVDSLQPRLMKKYGIYVNLVDLYREAAKQLKAEVVETYDHANAISALDLTLRENILSRKELAEEMAVAITATHDHADAIRKLNLTLKENILKHKELAAEITETLTATHDHTDAISVLDLTLRENILRHDELYKKITEGATATHDHADAIRGLNLTLQENIVRHKQLAEEMAEARQAEDYSALALERLEIDYQQLSLVIQENEDELAKLTKEHGRSITSTEGLALALERQQIDYEQLTLTIKRNENELSKLTKEHGQTVFSTEDLTLALERQQIDYEQLGLVIEENRSQLKKLTREHGQAIASTEGLNFSLERMEIDYEQLGLAIEENRDRLEKLGGEHGQVVVSAGDLEVALTGVQKRQLMLNAILEQAAAYAGTYEAAMTTAGKQIRSFRRYIEELMNQFGEFFLPMLTEGVRVATEFVQKLMDLPPATKELISKFLLAATAAAGVIAGLTGLVTVVDKLMPLIQFLLNPVGLLVTLLGVFVANWLMTGDVMTNVSNLIEGKVIPALQAFWDAIQRAVAPFVSLLKPAIGYIASWMDTLTMLFRHGAETGNWEPFLRTLRVVIERVKELLQPFVDKLKDTIEKWVQKAVGWWNATGKPLLEKALGTIWNLITQTIWPNYVQPALNWLIEHVRTWAEMTGWPFLQEVFESLWGWIKNSLWPWLEDTAWPWIKEKLEWLIAELKIWVETTGGPLLWQLAQKLWGAFWQSAAESIEIPEWVTRLMELIEETAAKPRKTPSGGYLGVPPGTQFDQYQYGGVVPSHGPRLAVVHGGETIIPAGRGGMVIEVPVYLDGREIARVISPHLADELTRQGVKA